MARRATARPDRPAPLGMLALAELARPSRRNRPARRDRGTPVTACSARGAACWPRSWRSTTSSAHGFSPTPRPRATSPGRWPAGSSDMDGGPSSPRRRRVRGSRSSRSADACMPRGLMAHALYRRDEHLLSLFTLPRDVHTQGLLEIMGQRATFWSAGAHTYAIVGAASQAAARRVPAIRRTRDEVIDGRNPTDR